MFAQAKRAGLLSVIAVMMSTGAQAAVFTDSYSDWLSGAGTSVWNTDVVGQEFDWATTVALKGGGSFTMTPDGDVRQIGSGWSTWGGDYAGQVIYSSDQSAVTLSLSGLSAFGFEVQPLSWGRWFNVTVTLDSGETLTDPVSGFAGAQFFGFYGGTVESLTISTDDVAFAFGNFVSAPSPVPLPASASLMGAALLLLAACHWAVGKRRGRAGAA